ncbi:MAG TPA: DUF1538 domain-containing protein [Woeseiaceae bacterium]|nr:DUF1538 domain-containing protein [Woeseiaceae bacterium]
MDLIWTFLRNIADTALDVLPVALFLLFFYRVVLSQKLVNRSGILVGLAFVVVGLTLLLQGLDKALFPVGRIMVEQLTNRIDTAEISHWSSYYLVYVFAFCIAFGAAFAEPALAAVADRVNEITGGAIPVSGLRVAAALGVAIGVTVGCVRIVTGIPLQWCLAAAIMIITIQSFTTPRTVLALAYDTGGVSTTAVTVPVVTALGLSLAEQVPGRSPFIDGFGLIAFACLFPAITVLGYAQITALLESRQMKKRLAAVSADAASREN